MQNEIYHVSLNGELLATFSYIQKVSFFELNLNLIKTKRSFYESNISFDYPIIKRFYFEADLYELVKKICNINLIPRTDFNDKYLITLNNHGVFEW